MKNSHNFMLKYEGAALADSTMDVAQLAPPDFVSKVVIKTSSNACGYSICVSKFFSSHVAQK